MTIIGYTEHQLSGARVVGVSHMSTHAALRFAESIGLFTGWLITESEQPQLEGIQSGAPTWVALAEMFVEGRVANTEGIVSGTVIFAAAVPANGKPPRDRSMKTWAEEGGRVWIEVIDNETAYIGGLDDDGVDKLLQWFVAQLPLNLDWRETDFEDEIRSDLRSGLFEHGWTRNCSLVTSGWRTSVDLWSGVHARCVLPHDDLKHLNSQPMGVRLSLKGECWHGRTLGDACPLDVDTGRATPPLAPE